MPKYDFRCEKCRRRFTLSFRSYADYDKSTPACPGCGSMQVARAITQVAIAGRSRDYGRMSSGDMLSVLDSGDQKQVGELFEQVAGSASAQLPSAPRDSSKRES